MVIESGYVKEIHHIQGESAMKLALLSDEKGNLARVFPPELLEKLRARGELLDTAAGTRELEQRRDAFKECEAVFSTWGMPPLTREQIREYLPSLRAVFYAAGSVQYFARPFLESGAAVFSAWKANAVPVAEFAFAQIILANKGYFQAARRCKRNQPSARRVVEKHPGNYRAKIGIAGAGSIGSLVCERLQTIDCEVLVYDPFLSEERARRLGVSMAGLPAIFRECDVISNHLANKDELAGIFNYELFSQMKPNATFINTGRGRQVVEKDLARALRAEPGRAAVLDVLSTEPFHPFNPLLRRANAFLTPHVAGSMSQEVWRMAEYMIEEFDRWSAGEETRYGVTLEALETMA